MTNVEQMLEWPPLEMTPQHYEHQIRDAQNSLRLYYVEGEQEMFANWQQLLIKTMSDTQFEHAHSNFRAGIYYRYAVSLQWRVVLFDYSQDFREAEKQWLKVIQLTPAESRLNLRSRYNIAHTRTSMHRSSGDARLLDSAVAILEECTGEVSADTPEAPLCWEGLSWALERRFGSQGTPEDLTASVRAAEKCVQLAPIGSPRTVRYLARLAGALRIRYLTYGDVADIYRSTEAYADLKSLVGAVSVDRGALLADSAGAWRLRYELTNQISDLFEAHEMAKSYLQTLTPASGNYHLALAACGTTYRLIFEAQGHKSNIEMAVNCHKRAVSILGKSHQGYPGSLNDLGNALMARYRSYHNLPDLENAINAYSEAVQTVDKWEREPIASKRHLLNTAINVKFNWGTALMERHQNASLSNVSLSEDAAAIDIILQEVFQKGLRILPNIALRAALTRGRWHGAKQHYRRAAEGYQCAMQAARQLFHQQNTTVNKILRISQVKDLSSSAAYCHAQVGNFDQAVLAIEQGRAILMSESLNAQDLELDKLANSGHRDLIARYHAATFRIRMLTRTAERGAFNYGSLKADRS